MPEPPSPPISVSLTLIFMLAAALVWMVFGALLALNAHPAFPDAAWLRNGMAAVSMGGGAVLVALTILLARREPRAHLAALLVLAAASIAVLFDDVGIVDLAVLLLGLVPLALLIRDRTWYRQN